MSESGLIGDWDKVNALLDPRRVTKKLHMAAARVGNYGVSEIKKGIQSGEPGGQKFTPLSAYTIARKGSSSPLIDKGDLIGSVTYHQPDPDTVFIGIKKTAKGGADRANIAAVHEFGCTIKVTPKMRAYLHANGLHLKKTTEYINIPPRPFIRPIVNDNGFREEVAKIYLRAIASAFGKGGGSASGGGNSGGSNSSGGSSGSGKSDGRLRDSHGKFIRSS